MTEDKSLRDKAVDIKGKQYVLVQDRVLYFNEHYPNGSITTELLSKPEDTRIVVKATIYPDGAILYQDDGASMPIRKIDGRHFTGYSQAVVGEGMVNKTAALENAETSAVGRALAFMGIGVIESIASADEVVKATPKPVAKPIPPTNIAKQRNAAAKRIATMLDEIQGVPFMTPQEYKEACEELTGLELKDENFAQIERKLQEVKDAQ